MKGMFRRSGLASIGILAALLGGPMIATQAPVASTVASKNAIPVSRRTSRRAIQLGLMGLGENSPIVPGAPTGYGWIYARTKNFRRKGVGSRWRHTMNAGRR
jgi:hypothetical protein